MASAGAARYVAVVDDDAGACAGMARLLRAVGMRVDTYSSAEALLATGAAWSYDCLVLDVRLTGMSGLELQQQLSRTGVTVPAIIVSAHDDPLTREEARRNGAVAFFGKTEPGALVIDAIERHSAPARARLASR